MNKARQIHVGHIDGRVLPAVGTSMLPAILPGDKLDVESATNRSIEIGDIVCFPSNTFQVFAHRVIEKKKRTTGNTYVIAGDTHGSKEEVEEEAIAFVVSRVRGCISYKTDSLLGVIFAHVAMHRGKAFRMTVSLVQKLIHTKAKMNKLRQRLF